MIEEQFRTLALRRASTAISVPSLEPSRVRLSFQRQHERRVRTRPISTSRTGAATTSTRIGLSRRRSRPTRRVSVKASACRGHWGGDVYHDSLGIGRVDPFHRYRTAFSVPARSIPRGFLVPDGGGVRARRAAGHRSHHHYARWAGRSSPAPSRPPIRKRPPWRSTDTWLATAGEARSSFRVLPWLSVTGGFDRSFRAPNLDDLTSRQQTGPGFQIDNRERRPGDASHDRDRRGG